MSGRDAHFTQSLKAGFERSGLNLSPADQQKLQSLRDQDAKVCGLFKKNLAEDKTELLFDKSELEGAPTPGSRSGRERESSRDSQISRPIPYCSSAPSRRRGDASRGPASARLTVLT